MNWTEESMKEAREYLENEYTFKKGFPEEQFEQLRPLLGLLSNFLPKPWVHATAMGGLISFIWSQEADPERGILLHWGGCGIYINFNTYIHTGESFQVDMKPKEKE